MNTKEFINQLDVLLGEYEDIAKRSKYDDLSDFPQESARLANRLQAAFDRMTNANDTYGKAADALRNDPAHIKVVNLSYMAYAFRDDISAGWLNRISELIRAETSKGMVEMATDLLSAGYKDAAAVIIGTAAELHLRALTAKNGIDILDQKGKFRKADALRIDLRQARVTSALQDKRISYWLGLRNDAAHGNYSEYTSDDVKVFISELATFMDGLPA
jgi:hypothetical protein